MARSVPGAASRARTSEEKTDRGADEQLVRDLTRHGPMARRIFQTYLNYKENVQSSQGSHGDLQTSIELQRCLCEIIKPYVNTIADGIQYSMLIR